MKKGFKMPAVFTILLLLIIAIAVITQFIPGVTPAVLADVVNAPYNGFADAMDVSLFVLVLGGFLGVVNKTGALDAGVAALVKKLNGKEIIIIPILMFLISVGGTTYGMAEETIAFYSLVTVTLVAAGFDSITAAATILLGSTVGVMGSTVNPFAVSVSLDALSAAGITPNPTIIIFANGAAWLICYAISAVWLMKYAKKVKADRSKSILTAEEIADMEAKFSKDDTAETPEFTSKHKLVMMLFAFTFVVMIVSVIPWGDFGVTIFDGWSSFLTGYQLGWWWFGDLIGWFFIMAIVIGVVYGYNDKEIIDAFVAGSADLMSVAYVIAVSRGISVIMAATGLDMLILEKASEALAGTSGPVFTAMAYIVYILLGFLIPSSSGLSTVSMPIFGPLAASLGLSPEIVVCCLSGASASINAISPTSGVTMGGIAISGVTFATWFKFIFKLIVALIVVHIAILAVATVIL